MYLLLTEFYYSYKGNCFFFVATKKISFQLLARQEDRRTLEMCVVDILLCSVIVNVLPERERVESE